MPYFQLEVTHEAGHVHARIRLTLDRLTGMPRFDLPAAEGRSP
jgi:hypothetical protein